MGMSSDTRIAVERRLETPALRILKSLRDDPGEINVHLIAELREMWPGKRAGSG